MNSKRNYFLLIGLFVFLFSACDDSVTQVPVLSDAKRITKFSILDKDADISESDKTIALSIPSGSGLDALTPTIEISAKASVSPTSGSSQDFTNSVSYKVTAEDNSTAEYVVTISDKCVSADNIYAFTYKGKNYEFVKEAKIWVDAAACAVERGGSLARIDNAAENIAIFNEIMTNSGVVLDKTVSGDGGNASYVWLGGSDIASEGKWIWDGTNSGSGDQFWEGNYTGHAVNDLFSNWGSEPDNFGSSQDCLGLGLTQWPIGSGSLGTAKQWNDVKRNNKLYFVIEFN